MKKERMLSDKERQERRHFLQSMLSLPPLMALGPRFLFTPSQLVQANPAHNKFILYIHAGSWCGMGSGLIMPRAANDWQRGLFFKNAESGSVNPNMNTHYQVGSLVFHNYTNIAAPMADYMTLGIGNPISLDHSAAKFYQASGHNAGSSNPSWIMGFTHSHAKHADKQPIVTTAYNNFLTKSSSTIGRNTIIRATNRGNFVFNFEDYYAVMPKSDAANRYWSSYYDIYKEKLGTIANTSNLHSEAQVAVENLLRGAPELAANSEIVTDLLADVNDSTVDALIQAYPDLPSQEKQIILGKKLVNFVSQLQLAGMLARSGLAQGMGIELINQDFHGASAEGGSSAAETPRSATYLWACIRLLWKWIEKHNMINNVMIIVSHEFARTPYDTGSNYASNNHTFYTPDGQSHTAMTYGTHHHPAHGAVFINGRLSPASRVGNVVDNYTAQGTIDHQGTVQSGNPLAAFTSTQLVGSALMHCFPELYPTERDVKSIWPNFDKRVPFA